MLPLLGAGQYDPPGDARVSTLEIFGPVICVYPYDDIDEALTLSNSLPYAFQASVFTSDLDTALRASRRLDASAVMVNDHPAFRVDWMPFAGLRESGIGVGGDPLYDGGHADQKAAGDSFKRAVVRARSVIGVGHPQEALRVPLASC